MRHMGRTRLRALYAPRCSSRSCKGTIRDGDVVHIHVTEDDSAPHIWDNHAPDPTIAHSSTPIELEPDKQETMQY